MSSTKEYLNFVLEQLNYTEDISYRPMMGEYIIYCQGKVVGGIYDNRFLVKQTKASKRLLSDASLELPYEGAKEMFLVDNLEDRDFLRELLESMVLELPAPKPKRKK